ncbi:hypothetical protein HHK36_016157 [Tetracentron sinense]|uniref:Uncharacterized protein n=1 Tax=Tetracentron sinense TaxID=13715 RepID=A0A835DDY5_TETSI|nr:hypothetical protein HHK36_016157 [Tetracentron sinense]
MVKESKEILWLQMHVGVKVQRLGTHKRLMRCFTNFLRIVWLEGSCSDNGHSWLVEDEIVENGNNEEIDWEFRAGPGSMLVQKRHDAIGTLAHMIKFIGSYQQRSTIRLMPLSVAALEAAVQGGTKVVDKEFVVLTKLHTVHLLKLNSIEAEGEK